MPGKTQLFPEPGRQNQQLGINIRTAHTKTFHPNLVELAIPAFLGSFVPEHGPGVPEPPGLVKQQAMLFRCPHATRCALRAQGQTVPIAVLESVHFLFDDVRYFTDGPPEQVRLLNDRHTDFLVAILGQYVTHRGFHKLPYGCLFRQDIVHPANCLNLCQFKPLTLPGWCCLETQTDQSSERAITNSSRALRRATSSRIRRSRSSVSVAFSNFWLGLPAM